MSYVCLYTGYTLSDFNLGYLNVMVFCSTVALYNVTILKINVIENKKLSP